MFYVANAQAVCQTNSREIANMLGEAPEEMGSDVMCIDFGGILVSGMERIEITAGDLKCSLLAHHLSLLVQELHKELGVADKPYVMVEGYPFTYALGRTDAEDLLHTISRNWNEYRALELHNRNRYEEALRALAGAPGVDVRREIAILKQPEVN